MICVNLATDYCSPDSYSDYLHSPGELHGCIAAQSFDWIVIAGDFNVDLTRESRNLHFLKTFMVYNHLLAAS